jgi:trk system potassium uptake protein TrkA
MNNEQKGSMYIITGNFIDMNEEGYMHTIIIGCGRIGSQIAKDLSDMGTDVAVIDRDGSRLNVLGAASTARGSRGSNSTRIYLLKPALKRPA